MVKLGFHVSIAGAFDSSVDRALNLKCDTFQIFTGNPRSWSTRELREGESKTFKEKLMKSRIHPVYTHMPYVLNLASPDDETHDRSIKSLIFGMNRTSNLDLTMLVTHIGSHLGKGKKIGLDRVIEALDRATKIVDNNVTVLLEIGSGSTNKVGSSFEELNFIIEKVEQPERIAICFDTCHAFAAGYELRSQKGLRKTLNLFESKVGWEQIQLVHLNDSAGALGSGVDRHEHIGIGQIGVEGFRHILHSRLVEIPMIMETPIDEKRGNLKNLQVARSLTKDPLDT